MILKSLKLLKLLEIKVTSLLTKINIIDKNEPPKPIFIVIVLLCINLIIASLMHSHVYLKLENYLYEQFNAYLIEVKNITHQTFKDTTSSQWQDKATLLSDRFDSDFNLIKRSADILSEEKLLILSGSQGAEGLVDLEMAIIYYPLDQQTLLELGPIPFTNWQTFIADWFSWIFVICTNMIFIFFYASFAEKQRAKLIHAIINLPIIDVKDAHNETKNNNEISQDIYTHLEKLHFYIVTMQAEHQSRLLLQRDLLHGVAHEFRSPMARMQFALEMLEDLLKGAPEDGQDKLCQSIHTSLADLDKLVKELLYYARLKDNESALNFIDISLPNVCKAAIAQVADFYPDIAFEFHDQRFADETIIADENLIKRMVINLLRNAGRFASSSCRIHLDATNQQLTLFIEDDGMGIPPGKAERIFEPFTRLDPSRSRDSGGCGLGLAIVSSIIDKHQGSIELIDGKLSGACFKICLPSNR